METTVSMERRGNNRGRFVLCCYIYSFDVKKGFLPKQHEKFHLQNDFLVVLYRKTLKEE